MTYIYAMLLSLIIQQPFTLVVDNPNDPRLIEISRKCVDFMDIIPTEDLPIREDTEIQEGKI